MRCFLYVIFVQPQQTWPFHSHSHRFLVDIPFIKIQQWNFLRGYTALWCTILEASHGTQLIEHPQVWDRIKQKAADDDRKSRGWSETRLNLELRLICGFIKYFCVAMPEGERSIASCSIVQLSGILVALTGKVPVRLQFSLLSNFIKMKYAR